MNKNSTKQTSKTPSPPQWLDDPSPWPSPVEGTELASKMRAIIARHVVLPDGADVAITLWVLHTYLEDVFDISPLLVFQSPAMRSGKTTAIRTTKYLVRRPLLASNVTTAALFRAIEEFAPTLFIDEAETFLNRNSETVGVLNSGQTRDGAYVLRVVGDDFAVKAFTTWCPKVIGLNGPLPPTLHDRSIIVQMRRRLQHESVTPLRADRLTEFRELRQMAARWANDSRDTVAAIEPKASGSLNDRAADNWRPLLAIASAISPEWLELGEKAASALSPEEAAEEPRAIRLLRDIRECFSRSEQIQLGSAKLVDLLNDLELSPWREMNGGSGISAGYVARLLKSYGVKPTDLWAEAVPGARKRSVKGYKLDEFADAFRRYLPDTSPRDPRGPRE